MLKLNIPYFLYHNKKGMNSIHLLIHPLSEISKAVSILILAPTVNFFLDYIPFFPYPCWIVNNKKYNFNFSEIFTF